MSRPTVLIPWVVALSTDYLASCYPTVTVKPMYASHIYVLIPILTAYRQLLKLFYQCKLAIMADRKVTSSNSTTSKGKQSVLNRQYEFVKHRAYAHGNIQWRCKCTRKASAKRQLNTSTECRGPFIHLVKFWSICEAQRNCRVKYAQDICALTLLDTSALYKLFTYLLT